MVSTTFLARSHFKFVWKCFRIPKLTENLILKLKLTRGSTTGSRGGRSVAVHHLSQKVWCVSCLPHLFWFAALVKFRLLKIFSFVPVLNAITEKKNMRFVTLYFDFEFSINLCHFQTNDKNLKYQNRRC